MKFSIVIPVYNVEKYIDKCLNNILKQTYKDFEVIIVNDGTKDNSQDIIDKYVKKDNRFKSFIKENGGLSDARNYGINYCNGDYLLFIDPDDYIEINLLEKLNSVILKEKYDIIKFKINLVNENYELIRKEDGYNEDKEIDFTEIINQEFCEPAWTYCYNFKFWKKNKFEYTKGRVHEDFGLTPYVILKANKIYYLNYYGYNYVQRQGSIISSNSMDKVLKKCYDTLYFYDLNMERIKNIKSDKVKIFKSFFANAVLARGKNLKEKDFQKYYSELKKRNVINNLLDDSLIRKIKKIVVKVNIKFYLKFFVK